VALSTDNVKAIAVRNFFEGMLQADDSVITKVMTYHNEDVASLRLAALTGIPDPGTWPSGDDLTVATVDSTGANTMQYDAYGVSVELNPMDIRDIPGLINKAAKKLGRSVTSKRANLAFSSIAAVFTETIADTHPVCSGNHTMTSGTRSNKGSTNLDMAAFQVAITAIRGWQNYQTQIMDWADQPKFLIVPPALEETARQILGSPYQLTTVDTSGAPAQGLINTSGLYNTQIVINPYASDDNDWILVADPSFGNPLNFWDRAPVKFEALVQDQDSLKTKLRVTWASKAQSGPQPDGIWGASVG
tara:strand:+ start:4306 stop:5214 length:909 start_codon:yes stop_codon:yes gene_type:complete